MNKALSLRFYEAASMQRWNDQIRVVDLTELDKQAHKMIVAYVLAKLEHDLGTPGLDWVQIVEAGIFEYLQRTVLTDIKPPLFHRIKENKDKYERLNLWVYDTLEPEISCIGQDFCARFKSYLLDSERNVNRRIISAAHFYATKWEFDVIERANPNGYGIGEIKKDILSKQEKYQDLKSMREFLFSQKLKFFVNICGQLRFQLRWGHLHRAPKTSVLGHMLIVAMFTYLFSLLNKSDPNKAVINYLTGLFHDLPEVLTRDIINPVKKSVEGIDELIKDYEQEEMESKIYKLIPEAWHAEMKIFTEDEFSNTALKDGQLVKAADDFAAFIEAYLALRNGIENDDFHKAIEVNIKKYSGGPIAGIDFKKIYTEFTAI